MTNSLKTTTLLDLNQDLIEEIYKALRSKDAFRLAQTCRRMYAMIGCLFNHITVSMPMLHYKKPFSYFDQIKFLQTAYLHNIPSSLVRLTLLERYDHLGLPLSFPDTLVDLTVHGKSKMPVEHFPRTLTRLKIIEQFNQPLTFLPTGLKQLFISSHTFNQPIDNLPPQLETLSLLGCSQFEQPANNLPKTLKILRLPLSYSIPVSSLAPGLIELRLGLYAHSHTIPSTLKVLFIREPQGLQVVPGHVRLFGVARREFYRNGMLTIPKGMKCIWPMFSDQELQHKMPSEYVFLKQSQVKNILKTIHNCE